jgi:hypothetical protein
MKQIAHENGYKGVTAHKPRKKQAVETTDGTDEQWATFTYIGKHTGFITKLFKSTNIKTAYKTQNTIGKKLQKGNQKDDKYDNAGVYKLKFQYCTQYCNAQVGRTFNTRYKEHIRDIWNNKDGIGYAQHILNTSHTRGNTQDAMDIIQVCEISSSHSGEYEAQNILGCTAVFLIECRPTFRRCVLPPSSP